jgi:hypothetical protein
VKLTKLNCKGLVSVNLGQYSVDWGRKVSVPQLKVKQFLKFFWENDAVYEEVRIPGSLLRLDLFNATRKLIVEVSPDAVHSTFNKYFHKNRFELLKKIKADMAKRKWAEHNELTLVELTDSDIKNLSVETFVTKFGVNL